MSLLWSNFVYDAKKWLTAKRAYVLTLIFLFLSILLGFIAVFVPWAWVDLAVAQRAYAYPFKTCIQNTFSSVHAETCLDNDFIVAGGAPLTQGSKCVAYVLTVIAFVFISVIGGVFLLLALLWLIYRVHKGRRPLVHATLIQVGLILEFLTSIVAWAMWIVYATTVCVPNSIFPVNSYSYGFVCYIFVTFSAFIAVVLGFIGMHRLKKYMRLPDLPKDYDAPEYVESAPPFASAYPVWLPPSAAAALPPAYSPLQNTPMPLAYSPYPASIPAY